jgi:hypothetical protein
MKQCGKGHAQKSGRRKKTATTLGYSRISKARQHVEMKPSFSMYPTRPASPTVAPLKARRRRKPDQLDMF